MKPGDSIIMIKFPTLKFAKEYCTENGLYVGCVCKYISMTTHHAMLETHVKFDLGKNFLDQHFKKYLRLENLDKILF